MKIREPIPVFLTLGFENEIERELVKLSQGVHIVLLRTTPSIKKTNTQTQWAWKVSKAPLTEKLSSENKIHTHGGRLPTLTNISVLTKCQKEPIAHTEQKGVPAFVLLIQQGVYPVRNKQRKEGPSQVLERHLQVTQQ